MIRRTVLLTLVSITLYAPSLRAQSLEAAFDQLDRTAGSFKSMSADIKRILYTAAISDSATDGGTMKLRRTKKDTKMLIEFSGTYAKTVSLEGETFKILYPRTKTIQIWNLGTNRSLVDQFLLLGFGATGDELKKSYKITFAGEEKIDAQTTSHLVLIPKSEEVLKKLKKAELWIQQAKGLPLQQKFTTSSDGDSTQVTYMNLKVNVPLNDSDLQLKEPKGVKKEYPQR